MAELEVRVFGRVVAVRDGTPVALPPLTAAMLARLLLTRGGLVTIDELFRDVWDQPTRRLDRGDRVAVHKRIGQLRTLLGADVIVTDPGSPTAYRLTISPDRVDALRFETAVTQALNGSAESRLEALAVWNETPMLGLRHLRFANDAAERWEQLHCQLLDSDPPAPQRGLPPVWRVPSRITAFEPRHDLTSQIDAALPGGPIALCGIGGVGKTRLAVEFAYQRATFYEFVWWVDADDNDRIGDQLAELAVALSISGPDNDVPQAVAALRWHLRRRPPGRWLMVFDNADSPDRLASWLPEGFGHVLITSRNPLWTEIATPILVDVFNRAQSRRLLQSRVTRLSAMHADRLAEQLGDLPLALAQAAGVMTAQGMDSDEYLAELHRRAATITGQGTPPSYPTSLAGAVAVSRDRLEPQQRQLVHLCALLAPETIPMTVLINVTDGDLERLRRNLENINRHGMARVDPTGLLMHRLTQAILRRMLPHDERATLKTRAERALSAAAPTDPGDVPATWPQWRTLLPHLIALDPVEVDHPALRRFAWLAIRHMLTRGHNEPALHYANRLHDGWTRRLGSAHLDTLCAARGLAMALYHTGNPAKALTLARRSLQTLTDTIGADHPETLQTENVLAMIMPYDAADEAFQIAQRNYRNRQRVLGPQHRETLWSAVTLADRAIRAGQVDAAVVLAREAWDDIRLVLGETHPWTHQTAAMLATSLRESGEHQQARTILAEAIPRLQSIYGDDHPYALEAEGELALTLLALGDTTQAATLGRHAAARYRERLGSDHPWTTEFLDQINAVLDIEPSDHETPP